MDARAIIATLRDGGCPDAEALRWFAKGLADGAVSDAQAGAFAMAVVLGPGLGEAGRVALTQAMRDSGERLEWDLGRPVLDKHSTGGVGDCVSLLLAPMLATCGAVVPMISGRGLGHTGGTLDKLEAIPGLSTDVTEDVFRWVMEETGCAIVSATADIAPADRKLYAVRDVTATVESVDLITASILAKKLAAGLDALMLDVKVGSGAFMATPDEARELAEALVRTANVAGCRTAALMTAMGQSLAPAAGNAVEVAAVMDVLEGGDGAPRLKELSMTFAAELLVMGGIDADIEDARARLCRRLADGSVMERFDRMVAALGGTPEFSRHWKSALPQAPVVRPVPTPAVGYLSEMDTRAVGEAVVALGGGRKRDGDRIDPSVGFSAIVPLGTRLSRGQPMAMVHAADEAAAEAAVVAFRRAVALASDPPEPAALVLERID